MSAAGDAAARALAFVAGKNTPAAAAPATPAAGTTAAQIPLNAPINTSRAGVGPAPAAGVVIARIIVVYGASGGLFIYNGTPAPGNPPILSAVAPGVTTDPYGNPVKAVLNIGSLAGAHAGFDDDGNEYLTDPTGATRIYLSPGNVELAVYTADTAAVALSVAAAALTDPLTGDTVRSGFTAYGTGASPGYVQMTESGGNAIFQLSSGNASESQPGALQTVTSGPSPAPLYLYLYGPVADTYGDFAWLNLQSSWLNGSSYAGGNLNYTDRSATEHTLLEWGQAGIFVNNIDDSSSYDIQRKTLLASGQAITATGYAAVTGITGITVANQTYRIQCKLMLECVTASAPVISFTGPALSSSELDWTIVPVANSSATQVEPYTWRTVNTLNGITGPAMTAAQNWTYYIEGQITPSASGTNFGLEAAISATGSYDIIAGSYLDLMPVTV
jgi:hypothetical protein